MIEQDMLALHSQYGDLYNEIVRPERKYTISHYLRTQWAPLLGAARLWFVIALRQRCFWNNKQDWCIVDKGTLARESGLSLRTVNRIIAAADNSSPDGGRDGWTALFFAKTRRRRYSQYVGRTVNAPNRYNVLLDDPLTPAHQAALSQYLQHHAANGSPQDTLHAMEALCACSAAELHEILSAPTPETTSTQPLGFVLDLVQAHCPLPPQDSALYAEVVRAASQLHNAITSPERVYIGNQYFRLRWLPELGPVLSSLVVNLRARCYWNERTKELRNSCRATWSELARELGCTARQLRNLRQKPHLDRFFTVLGEGHGRARSEFRVSMVDPLTDADAQRFETLAKTTPDVLIDPETGQLDAYALLLKTSDLAPKRAQDATPASSQPEILAGSAKEQSSPLPQEVPDNAHVLAESGLHNGPNQEKMASSVQPQRENLASSSLSQEVNLATSERQVLHLEGIKAEVLAVQPGNSGTTVQLQIITPTATGLVETTLMAGQAIANKLQLLAAARVQLLTHLGIQEPNRTRLICQEPRCDWIVGWGLYALTQPGLSRNRAGYIYNRLSSSDPPPQEFLELAGMPPSAWRLFHRAERLGDDTLIPNQLYRAYGRWYALLADACAGLSRQSLRDKDTMGEMDTASTTLPQGVERLLDGTEQIENAQAGVVIAVADLYQAYSLAREVQASPCAGQIAIEVIGPGGRRHLLKTEVLALAVAPLPASEWQSIWQELQWQMDRGIFSRWWQGVKPLGVLPGDVPCVVLGVPSAQERAWIEANHLPLVRRTLSSVLGRAAKVRFEVYGQPEPVVDRVAL